MPPQPAPHERVNKLTEARRRDLGLTWEQVAGRARLQYETIRMIRTGKSGGQPLTRRALSAALQWTPDSLDIIFSGGDPVPVPVPVPAEDGARGNDGGDEDRVIAGVLARHAGDDVAESIMRQKGKPLETRLAELRGWLSIGGTSGSVAGT